MGIASSRPLDPFFGSGPAPEALGLGPAPEAPHGPYRAPRAPWGGAPPVGPMGPQGPQEGTGSPPGGSPGQGGHGEEVRGDFWKTRFLASWRSPIKPGKSASKQAPQPPGPISIDPGCFFGPGGYPKSLESLHGDSFQPFFEVPRVPSHAGTFFLSGLYLDIRGSTSTFHRKP